MSSTSLASPASSVLEIPQMWTRFSKPGLHRQVGIETIDMFESLLRNGGTQEELFRYLATSTSRPCAVSQALDHHKKKMSKEQMRERLRAKLAAKTK